MKSEQSLGRQRGGVNTADTVPGSIAQQTVLLGCERTGTGTGHTAILSTLHSYLLVATLDKLAVPGSLIRPNNTARHRSLMTAMILSSLYR